jgi:hypothetical protein
MTPARKTILSHFNYFNLTLDRAEETVTILGQALETARKIAISRKAQ